MYVGKIMCILSLLLVAVALCDPVPCEAAKRRFRLIDDIALVHFGDPYTGKAEPVTFSSDRRHFIVDTERGLIGQNRSESTLRVFRTEDVRQFILHPETTREPNPIWVLRRSTHKDAPIITHIIWLVDSSGFAFLSKTAAGNNQLFLADLKTKTVHPLTLEDQDVTGFQIRDQQRVVYSVLSADIWRKAVEESRAPAIVGTGRSLIDLMFPADKYPSLMSEWHDRSELWAVIDGKRFRVKEESSGRPLYLHSSGQDSLALSPDGRSVVTALTVPGIPLEWESLYLPLDPSSQNRIRAGRQDVEAFEGQADVTQFVLIDLLTGETKPLTEAPIGDAAGWWQAARAGWSADGHQVVLSNTFLPPQRHDAHGQLNRPCVAVVDLVTSSVTCLERVKGQTAEGYEESYQYIENVRFASGSSVQVIVNYQLPGGTRGTMNYIRSDGESWRSGSPPKESRSGIHSMEIFVKQSFKDPPVLVATDTGTGSSRVILDPNPQLKDMDLGEASVLRWKDNNGRELIAGLYKPPDYHPGQRYPLVLQTHDFFERNFEPSGVYPTAFAARELAAVGIVVVQVNQCTMISTPQEGPCNVDVYKSAVQKLVADGLVDQHRIGIIGFSRTCYHVLEALTSPTLHFKAASITDGVNAGYLQYITGVDFGGNALVHDYDAIFDAPPFGEGLRPWLKHSPGFNMDKVMTPLQVVANGRLGLLGMWEPYAALRLLQKPVDLILLPGGTHVLTSPRERMVSQGGALDWFRFWLQGEEDPDPAKAEQYTRWRGLKKMQDENEKKAAEAKGKAGE